jgi:hypothetical protein
MLRRHRQAGPREGIQCNPRPSWTSRPGWAARCVVWQTAQTVQRKHSHTGGLQTTTTCTPIPHNGRPSRTNRPQGSQRTQRTPRCCWRGRRNRPCRCGRVCLVGVALLEQASVCAGCTVTRVRPHALSRVCSSTLAPASARRLTHTHAAVTQPQARPALPAPRATPEIRALQVRARACLMGVALLEQASVCAGCTVTRVRAHALSRVCSPTPTPTSAHHFTHMCVHLSATQSQARPALPAPRATPETRALQVRVCVYV